MEHRRIEIQMLGEFSLSCGGMKINDTQSRSYKLWLLLAYLAYHRNRSVSREELLDVLWGDESENANPLGALKTLVHRARAVLNQLYPDAGNEVLINEKGGCRWNPELDTQLDVELFEQLCRSGTEDPEQLERALLAYRGDFLRKLSSQAWVVPLSAYYHNLYVQTAMRSLPLLEAAGRHDRIAQLCTAAVQVEPYQEEFYQYLMRALLQKGEQKRASAVYEELSTLLLNDFGIVPSEESFALYRQSVRTDNGWTVSRDMLLEQLRETGRESGAVFCEYDFFKVLYRVEARSLARSGNAVHLAVLTLAEKDGSELPKRSLDQAMENLKHVVCSSLRRGDVVARLSLSQYVVMLPQSSYEGSRIVCERIMRAFYRKYPHTPARVSYYTQAVEPM